ncbi:MAG: hypothetical protein M1831_001787 [Alyxoria varia]|nr:MAG: hypothetical protein M1831_001787 [Alyxoria varia]
MVKPEPTKAGEGTAYVEEDDSRSPSESLGNNTAEATFVTDGLDEHYKPLKSYEGAHRFDPKFQWSDEDEKKVVRKLDIRICAWVCLAFFALQLDRGNITQALAGDMLEELNLTTNDYNTGQTIFYICFLFAELPSQMISKRVGPDRWIPIQMVSWSIVAALQAFLSDRASFWVCRALLGILEGGFIPDVVLYLTYFYVSKELTLRLSFFWLSYQATFIIGAFLAYGLLRLDGVNGVSGWRWLFAVEGLITGTIGIATYFYLPPSPTQTASICRGKNGWFSEHEEKIMVNRILRDDPSKGDMHNRQAVDFRMFWKCLKDVDMWPIYFLGLSWMLPFHPSTQYLTLQLRASGFDPFETNLLSIPAYVIFIINLIVWNWLSEKVNQRVLLVLVTQFWCLAFLITMEVLPAGDTYKWGRYVCTIMVVGAPYLHPTLVALTSRNAGSVRTRTVASAIYNMCVQASNIVGVNIYREPDKPLYRTGNNVLLGLVAYNVALIILIKVFYLRKNKVRQAKWDSMPREEKDSYLSTTKEEGNRRYVSSGFFPIRTTHMLNVLGLIFDSPIDFGEGESLSNAHSLPQLVYRARVPPSFPIPSRHNSEILAKTFKVLRSWQFIRPRKSGFAHRPLLSR